MVKVQSSLTRGVSAFTVTLEVNQGRNYSGPSFGLEGFPDAAMREHWIRVRSAIQQCYPTVELERLGGTVRVSLPERSRTIALDLPIAVGKLAVAGQYEIPEHTLFVGELSLDGHVRPVLGIVPILQHAKREGLRVVLPHGNYSEACLVKGVEVAPLRQLSDLTSELPWVVTSGEANTSQYGLAWEDVHGLEEPIKQAREAIQQGRNVLLVGVPGAGKTMVARRLLLDLPEKTEEQTLETAAVYSIAGLGDRHAFPFRAPHHTVSEAGMFGSHLEGRPGEVSLAHNGILFLDELPEFRRSVLQATLLAWAEGGVVLTRYNRPSVHLPANVRVVAAMNPCPCGFYGSEKRTCKCSEEARKRYHDRVEWFVEALDMTVVNLTAA